MDNLYRNGINNGGTDTHYTPYWVIDKLPEFFEPYLLPSESYLDPCPGKVANFTQCHTKGRIVLQRESNIRALDGLSYWWQRSFRCSFVNPPYSQMKPWIDKVNDCTSPWNSSKHSSLFFCKFDARTKWGMHLLNSAKWCYVIKDYVKFLDSDKLENGSATFQMCFAYFSNEPDSETELARQRLIKLYGNRLWLPK